MKPPREEVRTVATNRWREQLITILENNNIRVWAVGVIPDPYEGELANVVVRPAGRDENMALVCSVTVLGSYLYSGADPDAGLEEATSAVWKVLFNNAVDVSVGSVDNYEMGGEAQHPKAAGVHSGSIPVFVSQTLFATDPLRPGFNV